MDNKVEFPIKLIKRWENAIPKKKSVRRKMGEWLLGIRDDVKVSVVNPEEYERTIKDILLNNIFDAFKDSLSTEQKEAFIHKIQEAGIVEMKGFGRFNK